MIAAAWLALAGAASGQSVTLRGPTGETRTVSAGDLSAMPRDHVVGPTEHPPAKDYEGVPLTLLLQSVGAPAGKMLRGPALADTVLVEASDGYRVALSLAETDPAMRPTRIILADKAGGAPLPTGEGPFRLVIEGDLRPARCARMVTRITVIAPP
jgi:hypothetical protein